MTPLEAERAAALLATARQTAHLAKLDAVPRADTMDEAYLVQAALAKISGPVAAWKVIGASAKARQALQLERPAAAPIFAAYCHASPVTLALHKYISVIIECEFAFALARDLPPRKAPYADAEVADAVAAVCPAIEVVDSRVGIPSPPYLNLSDCFGNGGLVVGPRRADWRGLDLLTHAVTLTIDGKPIATGTGAAVTGGPLAALVVLANNAPPWSGGLKAGQVVTTGSCIGMPPLGAGCQVVADYGALGSVRITFAP